MKSWKILGVTSFVILLMLIFILFQFMKYDMVDRRFIMKDDAGEVYAKIRFSAPGGTMDYTWPNHFWLFDESNAEIEFIPLNDYAKDWYESSIPSRPWVYEVYHSGLLKKQVRFMMRKADVKDGPHLTFYIMEDRGVWAATSYVGVFGNNADEYGPLVDDSP